MYNVYNNNYNMKSLLNGIKTNRNRFSRVFKTIERCEKSAHVRLFIVVRPHRLCMMRKQRTPKLLSVIIYSTMVFKKNTGYEKNIYKVKKSLKQDTQ